MVNGRLYTAGKKKKKKKISKLEAQQKKPSRILEVCWFLVSTAKHWGQPLPLQRILKKRPLGQMVPICPDQGQLATSSKDPGWLSQIVTESKLALLATRQANESALRFIEGMR